MTPDREPLAVSFLVITDSLTGERFFQRRGEVWVERAKDGPGPHEAMPMCLGGWAEEADVLRLCERIR